MHTCRRSKSHSLAHQAELEFQQCPIHIALGMTGKLHGLCRLQASKLWYPLQRCGQRATLGPRGTYLTTSPQTSHAPS